MMDNAMRTERQVAMRRGFLTLLVAFAAVASVRASLYDVTLYGAKGDGSTVDSPAINAAIVAAANAGGGTVYVPAGRYLCYSIRLQSHVNLYLEQGCTLVAAEPDGDMGYDMAEPNEWDRYQDFGHSHWQNSLIYGIGLEDITISGYGTIDGRGGLTRGPDAHQAGKGNKAISLKLCRNVIIRDIKMRECGHFALLATGVDNLQVLNLTVDTNRDGFDIDCCRNVRISGCTVNTPWDDAIVLKASYALGYFRDTEDVTISDCLVSGFDRGTAIDCTWQQNDPQAPDRGGVTGRIKLGTESSGGFRHIAITNCVFRRCRGLALETVDGGLLEDVVISNITMYEIVNSPLFLRLGARLRSPEGTPPGALRRVLISNINVYDADSRFASIIAGLPDARIEDVTFQNIHIYHRGGYSTDDVTLPIPEQRDVYPEPWMFGTVPASGIYLRHASNIRFSDIHFHYAQPDTRPLFVAEDVEGITTEAITVDNEPVDVDL